MAFKTWADGEVLYAADLNTNFTISTKSKYTKYISDTNEVDEGLIIFGNGTHWSTTDKISTDSGATWSAGGFGNKGLASVSGANGIALTSDVSNQDYTTDSGVTWTQASTFTPNYTAIAGVHLFSSTIGVACGVSSSGVSAWYTADGGDNWAQSATGPTANTNAIQMASATIGYMVDVSGNIWKTTNAGADWTDTGDNTGSTSYYQGCGIVCIDTDTIIYLMSNTTGICKIFHYVNSTNTVRNLLEFILTDHSGGATNLTFSGNSIVVADNGNIYWILSSEEQKGCWLFMWDGTNLNQRWLVGTEATPDPEPYVATYGDFIYVNLPIYASDGVQIVAIDVRGD